MRRMLTILGLAVVVGTAVAGTAAELQTLMAGWERVFSVSWESGQYRGKPSVEGYVNNISPYHTNNIRIMIESLDARGQGPRQQGDHHQCEQCSRVHGSSSIGSTRAKGMGCTGRVGPVSSFVERLLRVAQWSGR